MKRTIIFPTTMILFSLFFSCQKEETYGYILRVDTGFYTFENDTGSVSDKTKWIDSIPLGEKVFIKKPRRVTFEGSGKEDDFMEIRRDTGKEGLVFAILVSEGGSLAVVTGEKANIYKSPKIIDVTGSILSRKTVLVYFPETERDSFVEFNAYDPAAKTFCKNTYIRLSSLSCNESDVQSSILLQTAQALKNEGTEKVRRDALLDSALSFYSDSTFSAEIQALLNFHSAGSIKTESVSSPSIIVNNTMVETFAWKSYTVQKGDSISKIAANFSVSMDAVIASNTISRANLLQAGDVLRIPNMNGIPYTVKQGDSLSKISKTMGVPLEVILDANGIQDASIQPKTVLFIPGAKMRSEDLKRVYPIRNRQR